MIGLVAFGSNERVYDRDRSVVAVSSFWGSNPPYAGYHPLGILGRPDCENALVSNECQSDLPWRGDLSLFPELGTHVYLDGHVGYVRAIHQKNGTLDLEMQQYYKRVAGNLVPCYMSPLEAANYPDSCLDEAAGGGFNAAYGRPPRLNVERKAIQAFNAAVWSPERMKRTDDLLQGGGMFGPQYVYEHRHADVYRGILPYTEWIEAKVDEPVYIFRVIVGMPRGAGAVVAIRARNPKAVKGSADEWVRLYEGRPLLKDSERQLSSGAYWAWSPPICQSPFKANTIRLELDTSEETGVETWNYIDYVQVIGSQRAPHAALPAQRSGSRTSTVQDSSAHMSSRVVYVPHKHASGQDSFEYQVTDCRGAAFRVGEPGVVSFEITPVNDAPIIASSTLNASLDTREYFSLMALVSDIETPFEKLELTITQLPTIGTLYDSEQPILTTPHTLLKKSVIGFLVKTVDSWMAVDTSSNVKYTTTYFELAVTDADGGTTIRRSLLRINDNKLTLQPGFIINANGMKQACPRGTYEVEHRLCQRADSFSYVDLPGSNETGVKNCPNNMRVLVIKNRKGSPVEEYLDGAEALEQCTCAPGFYTPHPLLWSTSAFPVTCLPCPIHARCDGATLPPVAEVGYALAPQQTGALQEMRDIDCSLDAVSCHSQRISIAFLECPYAGCLGGGYAALESNASGSDAVESVMVSPFHVEIFRCKIGYVPQSALCTLCDTAGGYAKSNSGNCSQCSYGIDSPVYWVISVIFATSWFVVIRFFATKAIKSIYIWSAFVQFLGLYSDFHVQWGQGVQDLLDMCSLFNLNLDLTHIGCVLHSYKSRWLAALCVPVVWFASALIHYAFSYTIIHLQMMWHRTQSNEKEGVSGIFDDTLSLRNLMTKGIHHSSAVAQCASEQTRRAKLALSTSARHVAQQTTGFSLRKSSSFVVAQTKYSSARNLAHGLAQHAKCAEIAKKLAFHRVRSFLLTYLPMWTFFLNLYYLKALAKCLEAFVCSEIDEETGGQFLVAAPSIPCWGDEHRILVIIAAVVLPFFLLFVPLLYCFILFGIVRRKGPNHPVSVRHFGFLYTRFEKQYYWWEFVELTRKLIFACAAIFGSALSTMIQLLLAFIAAFIVLLLYMRAAPFVAVRHDILAIHLAISELMMLFLGCFVIYRDASDDAKDDGAWVEILTYVLLSAAGLSMLFVSFEDFRSYVMDLRLDSLGKALGVKLQGTVFNRSRRAYRLFFWIRAASSEEVARVRELELALEKADLRAASIRMNSETKRYRRLLLDEPRLLDYAMNIKQIEELKAEVLKRKYDHAASEMLRRLRHRSTFGSLQDNISSPSERTEVQRLLHQYVRAVEVHEPLLAGQILAKEYFASSFQGVLLEWAVERANQEELSLLRDVVDSMRRYDAGSLEQASLDDFMKDAEQNIIVRAIGHEFEAAVTAATLEFEHMDTDKMTTNKNMPDVLTVTARQVVTTASNLFAKQAAPSKSMEKAASTLPVEDPVGTVISTAELKESHPPQGGSSSSSVADGEISNTRAWTL